MSAKSKKNEEMLAWLNGMPRKTQVSMAEKMGTSIGQLRQIAHGNRSCSVKLAVEIDKYSAGQFSMRTLAPEVDWDHVLMFLPARSK